MPSSISRKIFNTSPRAPSVDRFPPAEVTRLRTVLVAAGVPLREGVEAERKLAELRRMYEPYVNPLAQYLMMPLPPWISTKTSPTTGA